MACLVCKGKNTDVRGMGGDEWICVRCTETNPLYHNY